MAKYSIKNQQTKTMSKIMYPQIHEKRRNHEEIREKRGLGKWSIVYSSSRWELFTRVCVRETMDGINKTTSSGRSRIHVPETRLSKFHLPNCETLVKYNVTFIIQCIFKYHKGEYKVWHVMITWSSRHWNVK